MTVTGHPQVWSVGEVKKNRYYVLRMPLYQIFFEEISQVSQWSQHPLPSWRPHTLGTAAHGRFYLFRRAWKPGLSKFKPCGQNSTPWGGSCTILPSTQPSLDLWSDWRVTICPHHLEPHLSRYTLISHVLFARSGVTSSGLRYCGASLHINKGFRSSLP
jgi:hypothetical protein